MKEIKVEWCRGFIISLYKKHFPKARGFYTKLLFNIAKERGLYNGGYGEPISQAISELCDIEIVRDQDGNYLYDVFVLKE